ncbi:MAG TPA: hypothetical protein VK957_15620, partial [Lunatimonas sp.]|nr:hypothetical protein [Lunatimonas sp.]
DEQYDGHAGNMKDMGMDMSLQQMDMNKVMYPEILGEEEGMNMDEMDQEPNHHDGHGVAETDIVTLNYAMLKSPGNRKKVVEFACLTWP